MFISTQENRIKCIPEQFRKIFYNSHLDEKWETNKHRIIYNKMLQAVDDRNNEKILSLLEDVVGKINVVYWPQILCIVCDKWYGEKALCLNKAQHRYICSSCVEQIIVDWKI